MFSDAEQYEYANTYEFLQLAMQISNNIIYC